MSYTSSIYKEFLPASSILLPTEIKQKRSKLLKNKEKKKHRQKLN